MRNADRGVSSQGLAVAVVGAGATGAYVLDRLVRSGRVRSVTVFEAGPVPGPGLPYAAALNAPDALANIAGFEIPPMTETLNAWAVRQPRARLEALGIGDRAADARAFFPRVAIGAWLADSVEASRRLAAARGIAVEIRRSCVVEDLIARQDGVVVRACGPDGSLDDGVFDRAVVATGYGHGAELSRLTGKDAGRIPAGPVGILGTSLSAIDAVVALATAHGRFEEDAGGLSYRADEPWSATLMSRGGVLPEADFWFRHPAPPLAVFTEEAVDRLAGGGDGALDALFDLFRAELLGADPAYAARIGLAEADADSFADDHYFKARRAADPFAHARENLDEALATHRDQVEIPWRSAILRMHEVFGLAVPRLSERDAKRFGRGLKRVFADNYAAVPHLSIRRLLALKEAGVLDVAALGADYALTEDGDGTWTVSTPDRRHVFTRIVDARGQRAEALDRLPFPTLRLQICAEAEADGRDWEDGVSADDAAGHATGGGSLGRVHICALPFLLQRQPFVQGLVECARIADEVAAALDAVPAAAAGSADPLRAAIDAVRATTPIFLGDGSVIEVAAIA